MRDISSGMNQFGAGVDRTARDVNRALGLSGKSVGVSRLSLTPAGFGASLASGLKPGLINTSQGLSNMGHAVEQKANTVKNELEKVGADIDNAFKGLFKK